MSRYMITADYVEQDKNAYLQSAARVPGGVTIAEAFECAYYAATRRADQWFLAYQQDETRRAAVRNQIRIETLEEVIATIHRLALEIGDQGYQEYIDELGKMLAEADAEYESYRLSVQEALLNEFKE